MPNRLSQFWQELKRRNVVRVITVYAGAAFVIIELINNITEPLRLPEWTPTLVIVLLAIGFPIVIIFSWIYDIHPEGGIVKTEPSHKVQFEEIPKSSNSWKIASYISFVVIVGLIVLNIIPRSAKAEVLDKSIAVLPFHNDSPEVENSYIINGCMVSILDNLSKIKDLTVLSRESTASYLDKPKPPGEIAQELHVNYLLSAQGQKIGSRIHITVQLLDAHGRIIWSNPFDQTIEKPQDQIELQSQIALSVAEKIDAIITPQEMELIEKQPTKSLTALDLFQRGSDEYWNYWLNNDNREALKKAEDYFHKALDYDSTFSRAYTGLASIYWSKHYWESYFTTEDFLDSVLIYTDISLSYDNQNDEAYILKGDLYRERGNLEEAITEYDNALKFNPNNWQAYNGKAWIYSDDDFLKDIENMHKAVLLNRGSQLPTLLRLEGYPYYMMGFFKKGETLFNEALSKDDDSARYYSYLCYYEELLNNNIKSIELGEKGLAVDSNDVQILLSLGTNYMILGNYEESLDYFERYIKRLTELGDSRINVMHRIAYVYWKTGNKDTAEYYFDEQIKYCNSMNEFGRRWAQLKFTYYDLAGIYAFKGEKNKAYENLRIFNQRTKMPLWAVTQIKKDPLFDSIRDEPEFQQIVRNVEAKYQAEHERVRQWLEENDML